MMMQWVLPLAVAFGTAVGQEATFFLGKQGDSCAATCGMAGRKCNADVVTNGTTAEFTKLGVDCTSKPPAGGGVWSEEWQPAYVTGVGANNTGECLGYKSIPTGYNACNTYFWAARRLCSCGGDDTYRMHFGTAHSVSILPGNETTLYAHKLPEGSTGVITHFWQTGQAPVLAGAVLRFYVDGETTPSIDITSAQMASGSAFNDTGGGPWGNKWMGSGTGPNANHKGETWFNNFRIPFTQSIRVTAFHKDGKAYHGYYMIIRGARDMPVVVGGYTLPPTAKLRLQKFEGRVAAHEWVNVTDIPTGSGLHFSSALSIISGTMHFIEGCYHSFSPYNEPFPGTLLSSGTEDYFDSGWSFSSGIFEFPTAGNTHLDTNTSWAGGNVTMSAYKIHDQDPIYFNDGLRLSWRNGDFRDPVTGTKCWTQGGIPASDATDSYVVSYGWVYVWQP